MEKQLTPLSGRVYDGVTHTSSLGWFNEPFGDVNIYEALHLPYSLISNFRMKRWFYFFASNLRHLIAGALFDGGYYSEFFIYLYNRETRQLIEFEGSSPLSEDMDFPSSPGNVTEIVTFNQENSFIRKEVAGDRLVVTLDLTNSEGVRLTGNIDLIDYADPLVNIREAGHDRLIYTHQNSLLKADGTLNLYANDQHHIIELLEDSRGGIDFTMGYHNTVTNWYWASAYGKDMYGNEVAINFARDINVTPNSSNHIYAYWIKDPENPDSLEKVPIYRKFEHVNFNKTSDNQWEITSSTIQLIFTQEAVRSKSYHMGPLGYNYTQPIGKYFGRIFHNGAWLSVELFGVFEEHYAVW